MSLHAHPVLYHPIPNSTDPERGFYDALEFFFFFYPDCTSDRVFRDGGVTTVTNGFQKSSDQAHQKCTCSPPNCGRQCNGNATHPKGVILAGCLNIISIEDQGRKSFRVDSITIEGICGCCERRVDHKNFYHP